MSLFQMIPIHMLCFHQDIWQQSEKTLVCMLWHYEGIFPGSAMIRSMASWVYMSLVSWWVLQLPESFSNLCLCWQTCASPVSHRVQSVPQISQVLGEVQYANTNKLLSDQSIVLHSHPIYFNILKPLDHDLMIQWIMKHFEYQPLDHDL